MNVNVAMNTLRSRSPRVTWSSILIESVVVVAITVLLVSLV